MEQIIGNYEKELQKAKEGKPLDEQKGMARTMGNLIGSLDRAKKIIVSQDEYIGSLLKKVQEP